jgi:hypothetical protein
MGERGGWSTLRSCRFVPGKEIHYLVYRRDAIPAPSSSKQVAIRRHSDTRVQNSRCYISWEFEKRKKEMPRCGIRRKHTGEEKRVFWYFIDFKIWQIPVVLGPRSRLRFRVRIHPEEWTFVCCECCLCDGPITCPGESYKVHVSYCV